MDLNTDWYDILDHLIDDLDIATTTQQQPQQLQLARAISSSTDATTLGSNSPLIIHDDDDYNFDFGINNDDIKHDYCILRFHALSMA